MEILKKGGSNEKEQLLKQLEKVLRPRGLGK